MFRESQSDEKYWRRIERWNKHPDKALLTFLDVDQRLMSDIYHDWIRDHHFLASVASLQQISSVATPEAKLEAILAMFRDITTSNTAVTWSMDALLPVCMYVMVRARVPQLGAELAMLEDLMEPYMCQVSITLLYILNDLIINYPRNSKTFFLKVVPTHAVMSSLLKFSEKI